MMKILELILKLMWWKKLKWRYEMIEIQKARVAIATKLCKLDEKLKLDKEKQQKMLKNSKPDGFKMVRKGNKLYKVDNKTGSEILVGIYVKSENGVEILKSVEATDSLLSETIDEFSLQNDEGSMDMNNYSSLAKTKK